MSTSNQKPLEQDWKAQLKNHNFFRASVQPNGHTLKAEGHPAKLQPPPPGGGSGADAVRTAMLSGALRRGNTAHCSLQQFSPSREASVCGCPRCLMNHDKCQQDVLTAIRSERILYSLTFYSFIKNDFYILQIFLFQLGDLDIRKLL